MCEELDVTIPLMLCSDWMPSSFWCCVLRGDCESVILVIVERMLHIWVESEVFWNMTPCELVSNFICRIYFVNSCRLWKWPSHSLKVCHCPQKLHTFALWYLCICKYAWFVWCVYSYECTYMCVCVCAFAFVCVNIIKVNMDSVTNICLCRQCLLQTTMPFPSVQCHGNLL